MKNPLEITQDVLNGMIGIGGIPTNQEFYDEFNDRLKVALSLHNVSQQRELLLSAICQFTKRNTQKEIQEVEKWIETDFRK